MVEACRPEPGRSLAREGFDLPFLHRFLSPDCSLEDGAATLVSVTVQLIREAIERESLAANRLLLAGGGAQNPSLMLCLTVALPDLEVSSLATLGLPPEAREAVCFAALGWLYLQGKAANDPTQTGASRPLRLGSLALPL